MITREHFIKATGQAPENDDLQRCNCTVAGMAGHRFCGWDTDRDLPRFISGNRASPPAVMPSSAAFKEGAADGAVGKSGDCPYAAGTREYEEWIAGWWTAIPF